MKTFFRNFANKFLNALRERFLIMIMETLQDTIIDIQRNGLDDRKKKPIQDEEIHSSFNGTNEMINNFKNTKL